MTVSIIQKSSATFTDNGLPKLYRDPILNIGSLFLFDFSNSFCWNPANPVADGAAVANLLDGAAGGNLRIPSGAMTYVAGKGFQLAATATLQRVEIDSGTNYFQTNLGHDFLIQAWLKGPAADPGAGNIGLIFSKGGSGGTGGNYAQPGPFMASRFPSQAVDATNPDIVGKFDANTYNGYSLNGAAVSSPSGSHLYSLAKVGANVYVYKDGVMLRSGARLTPDLTANANPMVFGSSPLQSAIPGSILNRISGEDLTLSAAATGLTTTAQCAAQIAAEYATIGTKFA